MSDVAGVQLWGWDSANSVWVKVLVNAEGKLIIDPSEIFENPPTNGETAKAPQSDWAYDHWQDPNAHHEAFTTADHTAIGNAAPHHAEAHTLASHTTKAHAELTGIGSSDHHVKYTDAEAKAAAVSDAAYGAGWDGVTDVAPSKNAVYDKIQTLGGATKEFFVPCFSGKGGAINANDTYPASYVLNSATDAAFMSFRVPYDFSSLTEAKVIILPIVTGTTNWSTVCMFGANGQVYNTHTDTQSATGLAMTNNTIKEIDVTASFTGLAALDDVHFQFIWDAAGTTTALYVYGLVFKYA